MVAHCAGRFLGVFVGVGWAGGDFVYNRKLRSIRVIVELFWKV